LENESDSLSSVEEKGFIDYKRIRGGFLCQEDFAPGLKNEELRVVSRRQPDEQEKLAMQFGWKVVRYVKSNAVIYCSSDRTLGVGAGQMSRVDSSEFAVQKARNTGLSLKGSVCISDAFFPFRDGVDAAAAAGATAIIQPGGSIRDEEVIKAVDEHGMAMIFTGHRQFKH